MVHIRISSDSLAASHVNTHAQNYPNTPASQLATDLKLVKWLDDSVLKLATAFPTIGLQRAEVAMALSSVSLAVLDHPLLGK